MIVKAESAQERGMSEIAAAHWEAVESVRTEKKARRWPDDGTEFSGVRRTRGGEYGAQIWDPFRRAHVWIGTFGTAEEAAGAFNAAVVGLRGVAQTTVKISEAVQSSASAMVVKVESAQEQGIRAGNCEIAEEHGDGVEAMERKGKKALPDAHTKLENVHKYYNPTKDSRDDGKTYRFFQHLEALHGPAGTASPVAPPATAVRFLPEPLPVGATAGMATPVVGGMLGFSTTTDDMGERGKRKRTSEGGAAAGAADAKMMRFLEGLTKQVVERQERFLEAIEKREQDRMIREEAWRRQEMARLAREQEVLAHERAMAATRNAAVLSFIHNFTGQPIPMPSIAAVPVRFMPQPSPWTQAGPIFYAPAPQPSPVSTHPQPSPRPQNTRRMPPAPHQPQKSPAPATPEPLQQQAPVVHQSSTYIMTPDEAPHDASGHDGSGGGGGTTSSSRWTKAEVHALIQLRNNLDMRRKGTKGKGSLWEEISPGMRRMGYNRSSKECMYKWMNINSYFKKVKRPDDSKTCPSYFNQLEAFYRNKSAIGSPAGAGGAAAVHANAAQHDGLGGGGGMASSSSSSWSKEEMHALIQLRSDLDMRRQGTLWDDVSAGMRRMGYNRSSRRCIEKWANMNRCFKTMKESNKKRPLDSKRCPYYFHQLEAFYRNKAAAGQTILMPLWEEISEGEGWSTKECMDRWRNMNYKDSKACPSYFHQLEALYRNKEAIGCPAGPGFAAAENTNAASQDRIEAFAVPAPISQTAPQPRTLPPVAKNGITNNDGNGHDFGGVSGGTQQMQASNGTA